MVSILLCTSMFHPYDAGVCLWLHRLHRCPRVARCPPGVSAHQQMTRARIACIDLHIYLHKLSRARFLLYRITCIHGPQQGPSLDCKSSPHSIFLYECSHGKSLLDRVPACGIPIPRPLSLVMCDAQLYMLASLAVSWFSFCCTEVVHTLVLAHLL